MVSALAPYPDEDARERELETLAARAGGTVVAFGASVEGRPLRAARIPSTRSGGPQVLVTANIHGLEWVSSRTAMGVLHALGEDAGRALLDVAGVWVVPCVNVDGYARTSRDAGRGTLRALRTNARGVDLNRNFPLPAIAAPPKGLRGALDPRRLAVSGSADPGRATYRGAHPLSEPEAAAIDALCVRERFVAAIGLHAFMGTCIPPCVRTHAEARAYASFCRVFRRAQKRTRYIRFANRFVDVFTGELEDRLHHDIGSWALTVECFSVFASFRQHLVAPSLFWRFNPRAPHVVVDNDVPGVLAALRAAAMLPHPRRAPASSAVA